MADRRKSPLHLQETAPETCSVDLRLEILSRVPFFAGLSEKEIAEVNRRFHEVGFTPGETIYFSSDPADHLYVIASGRVKLLRHSFSGKNVLLELLVPGDFFGSLSSLGNEVYPDTAQAQTSACVLAINAEEFRLVLDRYPAVALKVLDVMAERLQAAHEMVRQLSVHSVERRLAFTLLRLAEKLGKEQEVGWLIQAPLSRDDLAEMTGTTTESASRVMSQFQKEGLIRSGRQWIAITDREGLQSAATEEIE